GVCSSLVCNVSTCGDGVVDTRREDCDNGADTFSCKHCKTAITRIVAPVGVGEAPQMGLADLSRSGRVVSFSQTNVTSSRMGAAAFYTIDLDAPHADPLRLPGDADTGIPRLTADGKFVVYSSLAATQTTDFFCDVSSFDRTVQQEQLIFQQMN